MFFEHIHKTDIIVDGWMLMGGQNLRIPFPSITSQLNCIAVFNMRNKIAIDVILEVELNTNVLNGRMDNCN